MTNCIRDDIIEYRKIVCDGREIKVFVLNTEKEDFPYFDVKTTKKDTNQSITKMLRFGGE